MTITRRRLVASLLAGAASLGRGTACPAPVRSGSTGPVRHLGYSDQGGRPDGVQVMVSGTTLYVGHMFSNGISVLDVADPRAPRPIRFIPAPPNTRTHHIQTHGDVMVAVCGADIPTIQRYDLAASYYDQSFARQVVGSRPFAAGLKLFDIGRPELPREIAFLEIPGIGLNRAWYVGGRFAYVAAHMDGFTDHILVVVDLADPERPAIAGRWWLPGMWRAGGEAPGWTGGRVALHHMIVAGRLGFASWRDGGFTVLDVSDPAQIKLLSHVTTRPPSPGGTHTALPLAGRGLVVVLDESTAPDCSKGLSPIGLYDVRDARRPSLVSTLPIPVGNGWCQPGENFGPHNLHENRPGTLQSETVVFATYHNAGLRIFDIRDAAAPCEIGSFVPPPPTRIIDPRPGVALAPQSCDINVQPDGTIYLSDWNAGLHVLRYDG